MVALFNLRFANKDFSFGSNYLRKVLKFMFPLYLQMFGGHERVIRLGAQIWTDKGLSDTELEAEIAGLLEKLSLGHSKPGIDGEDIDSDEEGERQSISVPNILVQQATRSNVFEGRKPSIHNKRLERFKSRQLSRHMSNSTTLTSQLGPISQKKCPRK